MSFKKRSKLSAHIGLRIIELPVTKLVKFGPFTIKIPDQYRIFETRDKEGNWVAIPAFNLPEIVANGLVKAGNIEGLITSAESDGVVVNL